MLSRLEAQERLRDMGVLTATNERSLSDGDAREYRDQLSLDANGGFRERQKTRKVTLADVTERFQIAPPDEETMRQLREKQQKAKQGE